ncbi:MAG: metallophosphoesterase family protein [Pseudomonadota bacterium]
MRIAVVSDIHGNLPALIAVVADFQRRGVDHVVNLGDSLSGPLLPKETAQYLMAQKDWVHLAGNHERQILSLHAKSSAVDIYAHAQLSAPEMEWIASLPFVRPFDHEVLLCHGTPTSDVGCLLENADQAATPAEIAERLGDVGASLILCGHTHVPRSVRSGGKLIVNPGSVGHPAYNDDHPYPHAIQSGSPDARYAIVEKHNGAWSASLISVPYAYQEMAQLARSRNRLDWERALLTGYTS